MQRITYIKTKFNPAGKLTIEQYTRLKEMIKKNPHFIIGEESVFSSIKSYFLWSVISFLIMFVGFGLGEGITTIIGGFAMLSFFTSIFFIVLEVPSKVRAFKEMRKYYDVMKSKIILSNNYEEFSKLFYGNS